MQSLTNPSLVILICVLTLICCVFVSIPYFVSQILVSLIVGNFLALSLIKQVQRIRITKQCSKIHSHSSGQIVLNTSSVQGTAQETAQENAQENAQSNAQSNAQENAQEKAQGNAQENAQNTSLASESSNATTTQNESSTFSVISNVSQPIFTSNIFHDTNFKQPFLAVDQTILNSCKKLSCAIIRIYVQPLVEYFYRDAHCVTLIHHYFTRLLFRSFNYIRLQDMNTFTSAVFHSSLSLNKIICKELKPADLLKLETSLKILITDAATFLKLDHDFESNAEQNIDVLKCVTPMIELTVPLMARLLFWCSGGSWDPENEMNTENEINTETGMENGANSGENTENTGENAVNGVPAGDTETVCTELDGFLTTSPAHVDVNSIHTVLPSNQPSLQVVPQDYEFSNVIDIIEKFNKNFSSIDRILRYECLLDLNNNFIEFCEKGSSTNHLENQIKIEFLKLFKLYEYQSQKSHVKQVFLRGRLKVEVDVIEDKFPELKAKSDFSERARLVWVKTKISEDLVQKNFYHYIWNCKVWRMDLVSESGGLASYNRNFPCTRVFPFSVKSREREKLFDKQKHPRKFCAPKWFLNVCKDDLLDETFDMYTSPLNKKNHHSTRSNHGSNYTGSNQNLNKFSSTESVDQNNDTVSLMSKILHVVPSVLSTRTHKFSNERQTRPPERSLRNKRTSYPIEEQKSFSLDRGKSLYDSDRFRDRNDSENGSLSSVRIEVLHVSSQNMDDISIGTTIEHKKSRTSVGGTSFTGSHLRNSNTDNESHVNRKKNDVPIMSNWSVALVKISTNEQDSSYRLVENGYK